MNENIYKYGVILNYFNEIFYEVYQNDSLMKYDYIVEHDRIGVSYGRGSGKIKYFKNGELSKIEKNGWFALPVIEVKITPGSNYDYIVKICDPKGEIKEIHSSNTNSIIEDIYPQPDYLYPFYTIDKLSKYFNWSHYDLISENESLRKKVGELEEKIKELENKSE